MVHAGELLPDGRPRFNFVLILVARQNGKTEIPVMLVPFWMFVEMHPLTLGTSTKLEYAKVSWQKVVTLIENTPDLAAEVPRNGVVRGNNLVQLKTEHDTCYTIAAANRSGGRSLTVSRGIMDEIREHPHYEAHDALVNATNAVYDAQVWAMTNQGDEKGVVLEDLRQSALHYINTLNEHGPEGAEGDYRLGLFEWSAPNGSEVDDPDALCMANPSIGHMLDLETLINRAKRAKITGGEALAGFKTEVLCMRVRNLDPAISEEKWLKCSNPGTMEDLRGRMALCLDVSLDEQHVSLVAAAKMDNGKIRVETIESWSGAEATSEARRALKGLIRTVNPRIFGWLPNGPAAAIGAELLAYGDDHRRRRQEIGRVKVEEIKSDTPAVCMGLAELVKSLEVAHSDDDMLLTHLCGAEKKWTGDYWVFIRKGAGHCDGAYATAGAVHLARTLPAAPPLPRLVVPGRK